MSLRRTPKKPLVSRIDMIGLKTTHFKVNQKFQSDLISNFQTEGYCTIRKIFQENKILFKYHVVEFLVWTDHWRNSSIKL